jgi:HPt (histidine-containing phosphotransfer) domain-containing protein
LKRWTPTRNANAPVDLQRLREVCNDTLGTMPGIAGPYPEQGAPVDLERLRDVCGDAPGTMRRIVDLYLEQGAELLPAMETAIRNNDAKDLSSIAHRFRGSSLSCGSNSIVPFLNELEQLGNSGNLAAASVAYEKARSEFGRIRSFFESHLQNSEYALEEEMLAPFVKGRSFYAERRSGGHGAKAM